VNVEETSTEKHINTQESIDSMQYIRICLLRESTVDAMLP
jgi:hypothetical protein